MTGPRSGKSFQLIKVMVLIVLLLFQHNSWLVGWLGSFNKPVYGDVPSNSLVHFTLFNIYHAKNIHNSGKNIDGAGCLAFYILQTGAGRFPSEMSCNSFKQSYMLFYFIKTYKYGRMQLVGHEKNSCYIGAISTVKWVEQEQTGQHTVYSPFDGNTPNLVLKSV